MKKLLAGILLWVACTDKTFANEWVSYNTTMVPVVTTTMVPVVNYVPVSYVQYQPVVVATYYINPNRVYWNNYYPVIYNHQYCWFKPRPVYYNYGY